MTDTDATSVTSAAALRRRLVSLYPAAAALLYPFLLQAFHVVVGPPGVVTSAGGIAAAAILLLLAFAVPLSGLACAWWWTSQPGPADLRVRRLASASIAVPPLFVFVGVTRGYAANLLGLPIPELAIWIALANRVWWARLAVAAAISTTIMCALYGARAAVDGLRLRVGFYRSLTMSTHLEPASAPFRPLVHSGNKFRGETKICFRLPHFQGQRSAWGLTTVQGTCE